MTTAIEISIRPARRIIGLVMTAALAAALAIGLAGCAQPSSGHWAQTAPTVPQERIESTGASAAAGFVASSAPTGHDGRTAAP